MLRNTSCLTPQARVPSCHGRAWAVLRQPRVLVTCAAGQQGGQQPVDLPGGGVWLGPSGGSSFLFGADYKFAIKRCGRAGRVQEGQRGARRGVWWRQWRGVLGGRAAPACTPARF